MHRHVTLSIAFLALGVMIPSLAHARIKLITLPVRERVEIQLDHEQATLVEEERIVPLVAGENQVDFSWAGTQIDPETIVFRVIAPGPGQQVNIVSVSYPPGESALVWTVGASASGPARVRISYLLGNLNKNFHYRAIAAPDEKTLALAQYMRLQNFANEEFASTELWAGFGKEFMKPVGINETKEMLMHRFENVPVQKAYTCDLAVHGYLDEPQKKLRVPMHYVLKNTKDRGLGQAPLPAGKVRIFIQSPNQSTAFLGEDWGKFTPLDDEARLYLGVAQDIVVKRTIEKNDTKRVAGNLYDFEVTVKYEIENFKDQPVTLDLAEDLRWLRREIGRDNSRNVQWELRDTTTLGAMDKEKSTFEKMMFHLQLPPRDKDGKAEKVIHKLSVVIKNEW